MGLDITVFEKVLLTPPHEQSDECWEKEPHHIQAFTLEGMGDSLRGLEDGRCYVSIGESWGFHAGSYVGYNHYREALCSAALGPVISPDIVWGDPDRWKDEIFYELINFADNEGTIGPEACADLAADFDAYPLLGIPMARDSGNERYKGLYETWGKAFHDAAGTGLIDFH